MTQTLSADQFDPPKDAEPGNWGRFHVIASLADQNAVSRMADGAAHQRQCGRHGKSPPPLARAIR